MKVRITGSTPAGTSKGKAWEPGSTVDVDDEKALEMVNSGQAQPVDATAVVERPSELVADAEARQAYAETEYATPQEKKQAALERQDLERGTHARLHQTDLPALAVADERQAREVELDGDELYANKGPVEARPDSAGYAGVPDGQLAEPVTPSTGPAKGVDSNSSQTRGSKSSGGERK